MQQRPLLRSVPSQGSETAEGLTHDRAGALIKTPARPLELVFVRGADTYTVTYQDANLGMMLGNTVRAVRPFEATAARGVRVGLELHRTGRHAEDGLHRWSMACRLCKCKASLRAGSLRATPCESAIEFCKSCGRRP